MKFEHQAVYQRAEHYDACLLDTSRFLSDVDEKLRYGIGTDYSHIVE